MIHAGLQQIGTIRREWWETGIKLLFIATLVIVFGVTALVILIALTILSFALSLLRTAPQQSQPGFFAGMATQVASFFVFSKIFGQKSTVPLTDYRIRDSGGTEYLVRVEGHIVQGALGTGDDVVVEGFEHNGTLFVRRGFNRRLNCVVRTRRK